mmetsp:Transcript_18008/g.30276  ORF Transcript_18008/g.30276 Transcript_18008/m.30276 type:complete len:343 (-) Transcript_18008:141-1169(-)
MALQPGVVHLGDLRVRLEAAGEVERVLVLAHDAQLEGLHAAEHEVGRVRVDHSPQHPVELAHLVHVLLLPDQRPGKHVVVARDVFGGAVQHEVRAEVERAHVDRRGEGAIDAHDAVGCVAHLRHQLHIDAAQVGVRRGLREEEGAGLCVESLLEPLHVGRVHDGGRDAHLGEDREDELPGAAVAICGGDDVAILGHQRQQHGGRSTHARRRDQAVLGSLQYPEFLFDHLGSGVAVAPVLIAPVPTLLVGNKLCSVLKGVRGSLDDRGRERICYTRAASAFTCVHGGGREIRIVHGLGPVVTLHPIHAHDQSARCMSLPRTAHAERVVAAKRAAAAQCYVGGD